jgi:putative flippase GtrA
MTSLESQYGRVNAILQRRGLRQFVKFCLVGASSTLIDFSVFLFLMERLHIQNYVGSLPLARILAASCAFIVAVTNGFIWNSRWTFRKNEREGRHQRYARFVLTNVIGLCLNLLILTLVAHLVPRGVAALLDPYLHDPAGFIGKLAATAIVVFWNFTASKYWTFKH